MDFLNLSGHFSCSSLGNILAREIEITSIVTEKPKDNVSLGKRLEIISLQQEVSILGFLSSMISSNLIKYSRSMSLAETSGGCSRSY